jgi:hypothetical protein
MLKATACGFGYLAFAGLAADARGTTGDDPTAARAPHFKPRAKRVIFLCMRGGPSHVDTFDFKPGLLKDAGKSVSAVAGAKKGGGTLLASPFAFRQYGNSGQWISEVFPHLSRRADDLCIVNGMHTEVPNHPQSYLMMHTGEFRFTRPSLGSWILYGLGAENQDLPGFITINPPGDLGGAQNYASAFLPPSCQALRLGEQGSPVEKAKVGNVTSSLTTQGQRRELDLVQEMNEEYRKRREVSPEVEGIIGSYELAFRMQDALPKVMDLSKESKETLDLYGIGRGKPTDNFGKECLLARRCAEAGVRFIEVGHANWDQHNNLKSKLESNCREIDQPIAALLLDLGRRGLLEDTLVLWGGEFGRTPAGQGQDGRNHNASGFSMWMAGGGVRGGTRFGATDEHGQAAVENRMHVHDLHATILHLLGLDHEKLTYRYGGRDFRLTDVHGNVATGILA